MHTSSNHLRLEQVAEGVYAALAKPGGAAIANAGIVDLGDRTLIFDTFLTPQAAQDLRDAALQLTGRVPALVINSHYHNDHIWGNQVFAGEAEILASQKTWELIQTKGQEEYEDNREYPKQRLPEVQQALANATGEEERRELSLMAGYFGGLVEAYPTLEVVLPTLTFAGSCEIHGSERSGRLWTYEGAHTGSDSVLLIPEAGVLFASDLLFVESHPYLPDGDPFQLRSVVAELEADAPAVVVPGHGPVGKPEDLGLLGDYVDFCIKTARRLVETGREPRDEIEEIALPEAFKKWSYATFFLANLRFLYAHFQS